MQGERSRLVVVDRAVKARLGGELGAKNASERRGKSRLGRCNTGLSHLYDYTGVD